MKIYEIIQEDPFQVQDLKRKTLPGFAVDKENTKHYINHGHFSSVYGHPDNPHDVVKATRRFSEEDGYEAFIRALAEDEEMRDNIYMPRIRTARVITSTKTDQKASMVRMERLEPLSKLSEREAHMLFVNLVGNETALKAKAEYDDSWGVAAFCWRQSLTSFLNYHSSGRIASTAINEDWLEALAWVRNVASERGWSMDLHSENWMVRRTPYGPQLVITDPFSWKKVNYRD